MRGVEVLHVVFMVARDEDHWRGPSGVLRQRGEARQAEVVVRQQRAGLVRADVAGQHQDIGANGGAGGEMRVGFQVQVGQQLQLHG